LIALVTLATLKGRYLFVVNGTFFPPAGGVTVESLFSRAGIRIFYGDGTGTTIARERGPDEGLGVVVGFDEVSVDGGLEISDALEHASLEPVLGQFGEEPFDSIEP